MSDYVGADPAVLAAGGVDLADVSGRLLRMADEMEAAAVARAYLAHGEDAITKALDQAYKPAALACVEALGTLKDLVFSYGQSAVDMGKAMAIGDEGATNAASGAGGRRA